MQAIEDDPRTQRRIPRKIAQNGSNQHWLGEKAPEPVFRAFRHAFSGPVDLCDGAALRYRGAAQVVTTVAVMVAQPIGRNTNP